MNDRHLEPTAAPSVRETVARAVAETPLTDIHTHLYAPPFGGLLLWGMDETLTYHYLIAEAVRATRIPYDQFWTMDQRAQADFIWRELFLKRSPVSEACRGVLTIVHELGLDVASRDLAAYRAYFAAQDVRAHVDTVLARARVKSVVMTNDPFDAQERAVWERGVEADARFHAALRMDPLIVDWPGACAELARQGYDVRASLDAGTRAEVRRFLSDWLTRMNALYMAVSLPPDFQFSVDGASRSIPGMKEQDAPSTWEHAHVLLADCVLPVAREHDVPFAMMIGVKRKVNPALRLAADGVGLADLRAVEALCAAYPDNKFMVTTLARENQHELCVLGRKFPNLFIFGCWWFLNNPSFIEEMTRMRLELLGLSMMPQHSDARILDQLLYKWAHSRAIIAKVLADKYADLAATGWTATEAEVRRDVARLLGGNFWGFLGKNDE